MRYKITTPIQFYTNASCEDDARIKLVQILLSLSKILPSDQVIGLKEEKPEKIKTEKMIF